MLEENHQKKIGKYSKIVQLYHELGHAVTSHVTTHLACQQTYPVQARGGGGGKTFC